jgi:hypothetical protein
MRKRAILAATVGLALTSQSATFTPRPEDAIIAIAAGVTYPNVHSEGNPGGEIRGRLCAVTPPGNTFSGINSCGS